MKDNASVYAMDDNIGLIKQCKEEIGKRRIQQLTKTYITMSMKDIADHAGILESVWNHSLHFCVALTLILNRPHH